MSTVRSNRPGRPAEYITDFEGKTVNGLSSTMRRKALHYYHLANGKIRWLGRDKEAAIREFYARQVVPKQEFPSTQVVDAGKNLISILMNAKHIVRTEKMDSPTSIVFGELDQILEECLVFAKNIDATVSISDEQFFDRMRQEITDNPKRCALKTGYEQLAYIREVKKPPTETILTLAEIIKCYDEKKMTHKGKILQARGKAQAKEYWEIFAREMKVKNANDITREIMMEFSTFLIGKYKPTSILSLVTKVRTVLHFASDHIDHSEPIINEVLKLMKKHIDKPPVVKTGGVPILREDLHKLLSIASIRERAIILLSVNCALHSKEFADVLKDEICLTGKTFSTLRTKTDVRRSAILWPETVAAIKAYQKNHDHPSKFLIVNNFGRHFIRNSTTTLMNEMQARTDLSKRYTFDSFRDSFAKHTKNNDGKRIVMGQRLTGVMDHYDDRGADSAACIAACDEVHKHYFG